jgi:hypothetical protein
LCRTEFAIVVAGLKLKVNGEEEEEEDGQTGKETLPKSGPGTETKGRTSTQKMDMWP